MSDTTPRVRGLLAALLGHEVDCRYNPACAGTTSTPCRVGCRPTIQPRVCGDYMTRRSPCSWSVDTTPRVRGLPLRIAIRDIAFRYNPACAGTTSSAHAAASVVPIQPRVCGDYPLGREAQLVDGDTTPRVRGLLVVLGLGCWMARYNPACAGTTKRSRLLSSEPSIQPRVCGDYAGCCRPRS